MALDLNDRVVRSGLGLERQPELTDEERGALRLFWASYDAHFDRIAADVHQHLGIHPELGSFVGADPASRGVSHDAIDLAITHEDWGPFLQSMQAIGARYAEAGVGFTTWFEASRAIRMRVTPLLLEQLGTDPPNLALAVRGLAIFVDLAMVAVGEAYVITKERIIRNQQEAIRELSTPVLELRPGLVMVPMIGVIDSDRARLLTERLLDMIAATHARVVILDVTGIPAVDSAVANHLMQTVQAAQLMGARTMVSGLSAENAQTLVRLNVDFQGLDTLATLIDAMERATLIIEPAEV